MRLTILILSIFLLQSARANMASPIAEGTSAGSAFSSRDMDILNEIISITIDPQFQSALFQIEYTIRTDYTGMQIPLLFFAKDYKENFTVWLDDVLVKVSDIPAQYTQTANSPFENFTDAFGKQSVTNSRQNITIYLEENIGHDYTLNDLKYFEALLSKGVHTIRVEYIANVWTDNSDWVKNYNFRYSLYPAQYWKSFGGLQVTVHQPEPIKNLTTNLGPPMQGEIGTISTWEFKELPGNYFIINYTPTVSTLSKTLINMGPVGITALLAIILCIMHVIGIFGYRRNNPAKKYSWVVISGSLIIPLIIIILYIFSFNIIDKAIGAEAGAYHGYTFLAIIAYPFLAAFYWIITWYMDKRLKQKLKKISVS